MQRTRIFATLAILLATIGTANAQNSYPDDGWWWDPDAPGRGYLVERQKEIMYIASFHYSSDGTPEWLSASGQYTPSGETSPIGEFSGAVYQYNDGQCLGCTLTPASAAESSQGDLTLSFLDNRNATLEWNGETISISRTQWVGTDVVDQLAGNWLLTLVENGSQMSQLVTIEDAAGSGHAGITNMVSHSAVGAVELLNDELILTLEIASEAELPLVLPETRRFYAGYSSADALQAVAVRLDDMPLVIVDEASGEEVSALEKFNSNVSLSDDGNTLVINTDGLPDHKSPYWGVGHELYEAQVSGNFVNPNRITEQDLTFRIPSNPQVAAQTSDTALGPIGVSVNGVVFYNAYAGINRVTGEWLALDDEIFSFDAGNGHPQQAGQYHYHIEPTTLTVVDNAAFLGYAMDGFPIYGPRNADGSGLDLDECNGETHSTAEYPDGIYHYHITDVVPYIVGCFRGTPGSVTF